MKKLALVAAALALVVGMMALAACSTPSGAAPKSSSTASVSSSSSKASTSSSSVSSSSASSAAQDVIVPNLKGMAQADAEKSLSDVGLVGVASNPEETAEVEPGKVFKQSIAAGSKVKKGEKIAFTVALALSEVEVPNVVGKTRDEAKQAITNAKLVFDYATSYSDNVNEGIVISQSAEAGSKAKVGSTVSVLVSLGKNPPAEVEVPNLMGLTWEEVENELDKLGLEAKRDGDDEGTVIAQDVAAGTKVIKGSAITVTLLQEQTEDNAPLNFVGTYTAGNASALVESTGNGELTFTITWENGENDFSTYVMSGKLNSDKLTVKYTNGSRVDTVITGNNKTTNQEMYQNGTGTITFKNDSTASFTWKEDQENVAKGVTFTYAS